MAPEREMIRAPYAYYSVYLLIVTLYSVNLVGEDCSAQCIEGMGHFQSRRFAPLISMIILNVERVS